MRTSEVLPLWLVRHSTGSERTEACGKGRIGGYPGSSPETGVLISIFRPEGLSLPLLLDTVLFEVVWQ